MQKAVQFGAGSIGRGFLAQLFTQSGYRVVFAEVDPDVIESLNSRKGYTLKIVGEDPRDIKITNVSAVSALQPENVSSQLASADIIATAVGAGALPKIAPLIARGLALRAERGGGPVDIIICENLLHAGSILRNLVKENSAPEHIDFIENSVGFVETVVSRMIPVLTEDIKKEDPLLVTAEEYAVLPADREAFRGKIPDIKGLLPTKNFAAFEERKLFIHNLAHAVCAYKGAEKGLIYIREAVEDPEINSLLKKTLEESSSALIKEHGFTRKEMEEHIDDLLKRFANRALGDTTARVGRDPLRKLGPNDRLTGAAANCLSQGINPEHIVKNIVSALKYYSPEDESSAKLRRMLEEKGLDYVLEEVCGLKENSRLKDMIKAEWDAVS